MFEAEANRIVGSVNEIPAEILFRFAESRRTVSKRTLIPWGEHCTECVLPTCYSSCELYSPRFDGGCQRFVAGMVRIDYPESLYSYILKISFKRWAKLWSVGNLRLFGLSDADRLEKRDLALSRYIHSLPDGMLKVKVTQKRYSWKKLVARRRSQSGDMPSRMLIECYNPNTQAVSMTLTLRSGQSRIPFQARLSMMPGFNRHRIEVETILRVLDLSSQFDVELTPNEFSEGMTLFFGVIDFVVETAQESDRTKTTDGTKNGSEIEAALCKCVVWDLDETLWNGTLIEDGREKLRLKPRIEEILKTLDERGVLISTVSKNNHEDAISVLRDFGIADYFLFPQISWNPKSLGIQRIADSLSIGIESLLFIDDSAFEREQVKSACPGVMVLDASEYTTILERSDCRVPVTEESRKRRGYYREQQVRDSVQSEFLGDYFAFLRDCHLRLTLLPLAESNLERVYELTQRTNQMNFSGNRYSRDQLRSFINSSHTDTYVLSCEDRFGAYGTIGFCTVHRAENRLTDLTFSCRIQAKRVEHAFVSFILQKYREMGAGDFFLNYRKTTKNANFGKVFDDFGFEKAGEKDGVTQLVYGKGREISDDRVVTVEEL